MTRADTGVNSRSVLQPARLGGKKPHASEATCRTRTNQRDGRTTTRARGKCISSHCNRNAVANQPGQASEGAAGHAAAAVHSRQGKLYNREQPNAGCVLRAASPLRRSLATSCAGAGVPVQPLQYVPMPIVPSWRRAVTPSCPCVAPCVGCVVQRVGRLPGLTCQLPARSCPRRRRRKTRRSCRRCR